MSDSPALQGDDDLLALMKRTADHVYARVLSEVCVERASSRVLDGVLQTIFHHLMLSQPTEAELLAWWLDASRPTLSDVLPPRFDGLPMLLQWDYLGAEMFPEGRWSTADWIDALTE